MNPKTLDRYILKQTSLFWILSLVSLTLLIMLSRFFSDISMFIENNTDMITVVKYLMFSYPQMIYWVLPFSVCLGILASQAYLSRHSEIIAMQACAVSMHRIYLSFFVLGFFTTLIMMALSFYLSPLSQKEADTIEDIFIRKRDVTGSFSVSGGKFKVENCFYYIDHLDIKRGIMKNVVCYQVKSGKITSIMEAKSATWDSTSHTGKWVAKDLTSILFTEKNMIIQQSGELPLLKPPEDLVMASPRPDVLTLKELGQYIGQLRQDNIHSASIETQYHGRISFAFAPLIITLLVVPFGMRFPRTGGIARGIVSGLILGLAYWAFHSAMLNLGTSGHLSPPLAAWTANTLSIFLGGILIYVRKGIYG